MLLCVLICFHKDQFILQLQEVFNQLQHFHIFLQCSKFQSSVTALPQIKSIICFKSVTCHILCTCTYFLYYIWYFLFKVKNPPLTLVSKGCAVELITTVPRHRVSWAKTRFQNTKWLKSGLSLYVDSWVCVSLSVFFVEMLCVRTNKMLRAVLHSFPDAMKQSLSFQHPNIRLILSLFSCLCTKSYTLNVASPKWSYKNRKQTQKPKTIIVW